MLSTPFYKNGPLRSFDGPPQELADAFDPAHFSEAVSLAHDKLADHLRRDEVEGVRPERPADLLREALYASIGDRGGLISSARMHQFQMDRPDDRIRF